MNDKTVAGDRRTQADHTTNTGILGPVNRARRYLDEVVRYDPMNPPRGQNPMRFGYPTD